MASVGCLLLSPISAYAQTNLPNVDCMAAADPDACITQLTQIAAQAAAAPKPTTTPAATTASPPPAEPPVSSKPPVATTAPPPPVEPPASSTPPQPTEAVKPVVVETKEPPKPVKPVAKKPSYPAAATPVKTAPPVIAPPVSSTDSPVTPTKTTATTTPQPAEPAYMMGDTSTPVQPDLIASTIACQKTPDPDQCVQNLTNKQGAPVKFDPRNLPLNTDMLGWSGPFKMALRYDAELSWILGLDYMQMLTESFGVSIKTGIGPKERRANITAGFAIGTDQQIKLTYEYLAQQLNFDFASGGVEEWVDQNAVGAAYQYLIRKSILHSIEVSGYTIRANSKDLSDVIFNVNTVTNPSGATTESYDINYRRIAGGTENTIQAALNLLPLKDTALTIGGGYSQISYDTQYESNQARSAIAYQLQLTHLLSEKTKFIAAIQSTAAGTTESAEIRHLFSHAIELSIKGQYTSGAGLPSSSSILLGFSYPAPESYSLTGFTDLQELKSWIEKPVVYAPRVLAIKDEKVVHYAANALVVGDQTLYVNGSPASTQEIVPVLMNTMFQFQDPALTINYSCSAVDKNATPIDCSNLLLAIDPTTGSQAQLVSTTPTTSGLVANSPYTITIAANASRPDVPPLAPITSSFKLFIQNAPIFPSTPYSIDFDTTGGAEVLSPGQLQLVQGLHKVSDSVINLTTAVPGAIGFTLDPDFTQTYWRIVADPANPSNFYLLRNLDSQGNLSAQDIGTLQTVNICVQEDAYHPCYKSTVQVNISANAVTHPANAGTVAVNVPTPFQINSGATTSGGWNMDSPNAKSNLNSVIANTINPITVPIIDDSYNGWTNPVITAGSNPPWANLAFSGSNLVNKPPSDIVAPVIDSAGSNISYPGTFMVTSTAAGTTPVTATFNALVLVAPWAPVWDTTPFSIRFDFTSQGNIDAGFTQQPSDTLLDLSAMIKDGDGNVVPGVTFSWQATGMTNPPNWQLTPCPTNAQHTCLFRNSVPAPSEPKGIILDASDVTPLGGPPSYAPILCATYQGNETCQSTPNFQVVADTIVAPTNVPYILGSVPQSEGLAPFWLVEVCAGQSINPFAATVASPTTQSYFVGQNLFVGTNAVRIVNDTIANFGGLVKFMSAGGGNWINLATSGALTGTTPSTASGLDGYSFTATSKAAGGALPPAGGANMEFYINILPSSSPQC